MKIKSHQDLIEDWVKSHSFFKNLESLLNFNFSNTSLFTGLLEESRKSFISMPENKRSKGESIKLNNYYLKFLNYFREKISKNDTFISKNTNDNDVNQSYIDNDMIKNEEKLLENKMNIPEFVYEKIKEFIKICLFKNDKKNKNSTLSRLNSHKTFLLNQSSKQNQSPNIINKDYKIPVEEVIDNQNSINKNNISNKNNETSNSIIFRFEVLENIFKNFKHYSHHDNHYYMESSWKLYDLNDLGIMQFHMFMFDIIIEEIQNNENFPNQISISNWYI